MQSNVQLLCTHVIRIQSRVRYIVYNIYGMTHKEKHTHKILILLEVDNRQATGGDRSAEEEGDGGATEGDGGGVTEGGRGAADGDGAGVTEGGRGAADGSSKVNGGAAAEERDGGATKGGDTGEYITVGV